jgi:hypothetical protein
VTVNNMHTLCCMVLVTGRMLTDGRAALHVLSILQLMSVSSVPPQLHALRSYATPPTINPLRTLLTHSTVQRATATASQYGADWRINHELLSKPGQLM